MGWADGPGVPGVCPGLQLFSGAVWGPPSQDPLLPPRSLGCRPSLALYPRIWEVYPRPWAPVPGPQTVPPHVLIGAYSDQKWQLTD